MASVPNFDSETLARWRQDRVSDPSFDPRGLSIQQLKSCLEICEQDLAAEEQSIELTKLHLSKLRSNVAALRKKQKKIIAALDRPNPNGALMHPNVTVTVKVNGKDRKRKQLTCPMNDATTTVIHDGTECRGCGRKFNLYGQELSR